VKTRDVESTHLEMMNQHI